ncbi:MAG: hypothetical protein WAM97_11420 [Acidimicrobiales bacterium]|jgi:hypothetical protein
MDNYYKRPSPQEQRYRDVLEAISALGPEATDLANELDDVVWQVVRRAVDVAVADHDRRMLTSISRSGRVEPVPRIPDDGVEEEETVRH